MKICPICSKRYEDSATFCPSDGSGLVPMPEEEPENEPDPVLGSSIFGSYVLKKKLGEGGMGSVYLAENAAIEHRIAVKVLHGSASQSDELVKRFYREAKTIARLTHPNVVRVLVFGQMEDGIALAMEFVEGKPLRDVIEKNGRIDESRAINIMRQVLHAMAEAHELGIVHRDLKPDNIMLTRFRGVDDYVKVLDFGIAKVKEPEGKQAAKLTQAGVVYGTPEYLSPEQAQAKELDGRSDIYSLGCILYELVTGSVPFTASTAVAILAAHVYDAPRPPSQISKAQISPKMEQIILKAMEKDLNKRYQNAMAFLNDLENLERDLIGEAATKTTMLDPRQMSLVLEVSRAAAQRQDHPSAPARSTPQPQPAPQPQTAPQRTPAPSPAPAPAPTPAPVAAPQLQSSMAPSHFGNTVPVRGPAQAAAPAQGGRQLILITIIACLVILLLMAIVGLFVVLKRQQNSTAELDAPGIVDVETLTA